jgi:O-antigen ligase
MNPSCPRRPWKDAVRFIAYVAGAVAVAILPILGAPIRRVAVAFLLIMYLPSLLIVFVSAIRNPEARHYLRSALPDMYRVHPFSQVRGLLRLPAILLAAFFSVTFALFLPFVATYGVVRVGFYRLVGRPLACQKHPGPPSR